MSYIKTQEIAAAHHSESHNNFFKVTTVVIHYINTMKTTFLCLKAWFKLNYNYNYNNIIFILLI